MVRVSSLASLKGAAAAWASSFLGLALACLVSGFFEGDAGVVTESFCGGFSCFMAGLAGAAFPIGRAVSLFRFAMSTSVVWVVVVVLMGRRLFVHCPTSELRLSSFLGWIFLSGG